MNELLTGNLHRVWRKYLFAALGSAIIQSIYTTADIIIVGQYEGPNGAAAMAVMQPMWSFIMAVGLLFAVGGSVMLGVARGAKDTEGESFFSVTLLASAVASALLVLLFRLYRFPLYRFFGADEVLLPYVESYAGWLAWFLPAFLMGQVLIFFLRNDGAPVLATIAVASCGALNIFGDLLLVFGFDMGMEGAGIATVLCQVIADGIMCIHFFRKKCTLRLVWPKRFGRTLLTVFKTGFSPFITDLSVFFTSILFNNRIMHLSGATELAVYGTCSSIGVLVLSMSYGVGGALQPIASACCGAKDFRRMKKVLQYALTSAALIAAIFLAAAELLPAPVLRAYMDVTPEVLAVGPQILRIIALYFPFMALNITASYYLQSVLCSDLSLTVSLMRGIAMPCLLLFTLPEIFGFSAIWWTTPLAELLTAAAAFYLIRKQLKNTNKEN